MTTYKLKKCQLTVPVLAEMVVRRIARFARTGLIVSANAELIHHLFLEAFNLSLWRRVGGLHYFNPIDGKFVLHFDSVVSDRSATVALRFFPFQRHTDVIIVEDLWLARFARLVCWEYYIKLTK